MDEQNSKHVIIRKTFFLVFAVTVLFVVAATYYRYMVMEDFVIETKSMEEFTDEDF